MDINPEQNDYSLLSVPKLELCKAKIMKREDEFEFGQYVCHWVCAIVS